MVTGVMNQIGLAYGSPSNRGVVIGPTSAGGPLQFIADPGSAGLVFTSNTSGTNPSWEPVSASMNLTFKNAVRVGTIANLSADYDNGTAGVGATLTNNSTQVALSIDGVGPLSVGDRVLVKNQTNDFENGLYTVTTVGTGAVDWVLTRATDYNQDSEIFFGDFVVVVEGTVNAGTEWIQQSASAPTIGTDDITFAQSAGDVQSVSGTSNRITSTGGANPVIDISASYVGQSSITTLGTIGTGVWQGTTNAVGFGGTGSTSFTGYATVASNSGGTALVSIGPGTAGQIYKSNGAGAASSFANAAYVSPPATETANATLVANLTTYANSSSGAITLTMPASPSVGDRIITKGINAAGSYIVQMAGSQVARFIGNYASTAGGTVTPADAFATIEWEYVASNVWLISNLTGQATFA